MGEWSILDKTRSAINALMLKPPHLPTTKEVFDVNKSQRKAMLIRRKWRRVREKRIRATVKLILKKER